MCIYSVYVVYYIIYAYYKCYVCMCIWRKCERLSNRGLALNLLCNTGWPQIHSPPFPSSQVFELQVCVTICGFEIS